MTDTSFSVPEGESDEGAAEGEAEGDVGLEDGVEVGEGDGEAACRRKREGAVTVVIRVVVTTFWMVVVTGET